MLDGLQKAEASPDGDILISRLAEYVQSRVPKITEEQWHYVQSPLFMSLGPPFPIARR